MALDTTTIELGQTGNAPLTYKLKSAEAFAPQTVSAQFDGTGASGPFLACLTFKAQDGKVIARCPIDSAMAVGDVAEVTYAPFLRAGAGAGAAGIQYDVDNSGDWFTLITTSFEPIVGNGIFLHATGDGNDIQLTSEGGINLNDVHGWGIVINSTTGTGGSADITNISGRDFVVNAGRDVDVQAANFLNLASLGTADLGASAQLQISASGTGNTINIQVNNATGKLFIQGTAGALIVLDPTVLPIANPGVPGALWNNAGVLNVS